MAAAVAATFWTAVGTTNAVVVGVGASIGLSATTSLAIGHAALNLAIYAAIGAATTPSIPDPEGGKFNVRQPRPVRRYGVGTCRVSGASMLYEADLNILHHVIAFPEGPVGHWGSTWLNDDEVTVTAGVVQQLADKRYKTGLVLIQDREGLETETAYADLVTEYGSVWTSLHRGDGIPSAWVRCQGGSLNVFNKTYPGGAPVLTREAFFTAYDWRLDSTSGGSGTHRRNDPTTWAETDNVVVWTVNILWRRYGQDWDRRFAPSLAVLTTEANVCDENVTLKAGGTVDRYKVGFWFEALTPIKVFLTAMLAAMDGHFSVRRDGAFIIRAGHYVAPTIIFGDDEIIDWSFDPGPAPDAVINVLMCSFVDPAEAYSQVDCAPWRDETSITTHGERPQDFFPQGVQSQSQVRRLAKAAMDRNMAGSGYFKTPLSARRGMGERFIGIRCSDVDDLNDVVVEIMDVSLDLASASITWTYKIANANRYDWTAASEEGDPADSQDRPAPVDDVPPTIVGILPFYENLGPAGDGIRLTITGTGPDREDLLWFVQWRTLGSTTWTSAEVTDQDATPNFEGDSGFVPATGTLEVQLGYQTGGGTLVWSTTETIDPSTVVGSFIFYRAANSGLLPLAGF